MFILKVGCSIGIFLNSANLICRSTDISKGFRRSLPLRDNESRLYIKYLIHLFCLVYNFNIGIITNFGAYGLCHVEKYLTPSFAYLHTTAIIGLCIYLD